MVDIPPSILTIFYLSPRYVSIILIMGFMFLILTVYLFYGECYEYLLLGFRSFQFYGLLSNVLVGCLVGTSIIISLSLEHLTLFFIKH